MASSGSVQKAIECEQELSCQGRHAAGIAGRGFEIEGVERADEAVHETRGQHKDENGIEVVPEGMIEVVVSPKIIEGIVFNIPAGMPDTADRFGGGFGNGKGGHPIPVRGCALAMDRFGFAGANDPNLFLDRCPGGEFANIPAKIFVFAKDLFCRRNLAAETVGIGE